MSNPIVACPNCNTRFSIDIEYNDNAAQWDWEMPGACPNCNKYYNENIQESITSQMNKLLNQRTKPTAWSDADVQQLKNKITDQESMIAELTQNVEQLCEPPLAPMIVLGHTVVQGNKCVILSSGISKMIVRTPVFELNCGDTVLTTKQGSIASKLDNPSAGEIVVVDRVVVELNRIEVSTGFGKKLVQFTDNTKNVQVGDSIVLDLTSQVAIAKLATQKNKYDFSQDTGVNWNDIGGNEQAKKEMIEAIELPFTHAALFKHYGKPPVKGVVLYGPPGCGKTMLGKAAATSIARHVSKDVPSAFMYVKGPEILDSFVGASEANIRALFGRARKHKQAYGVPAVIFIDEAEAILGKRGSRGSMMEKTIVPQFLSEMDGLDEAAAIVLLATNRQDSLDPAITREGRMDRKIKVTRPSPVDAESIFKLNLKRIPLAIDCPIEHAASVARDALFSDSRLMFIVQTIDGSVFQLRLRDIVSGALISGVVEKAISSAMHRDMQLKVSRYTGITASDLVDAVHQTHMQNMDLNLEDAINDLTGGRQVTNIIKAPNGTATARA